MSTACHGHAVGGANRCKHHLAGPSLIKTVHPWKCPCARNRVGPLGQPVPEPCRPARGAPKSTPQAVQRADTGCRVSHSAHTSSCIAFLSSSCFFCQSCESCGAWQRHRILARGSET